MTPVLSKLVIVATAALAGCSEAATTLTRDHYASLEDCAADWGRPEACDRVQSSGYPGVPYVFRGPAYPDNGRDAVRREVLAEAERTNRPSFADPARQGRAIGTVREPLALDGAPRPGRSAPPEPQQDDEPASVAESLSGLPYSIAYFGIALMLLTLALALYVALAARREMRLVRDGNVAVAAGMAGVLVGFALPLASALLASGTLLDLLVWAAAALLVQLVVLLGVRAALGALARRMRDGQVASGVFIGAVAVVLGLLNAASIFIGF